MAEYQIKELLSDGNEKQIYSTQDPDKVIVRYKDIATAYGKIKRAVFKGKGEVNNKISAILFNCLSEHGIKSHFIEINSENEQLCHKVELIPLEVVAHNRYAGSLARHLGIEEGVHCANPIVELRYDSDDMGKLLINNDIAIALGLATREEVNFMHETTLKANEALNALFTKAGISLVDFKFDFGRTSNGEVLICGEISPDKSRLWDIETGKRLDKDRFRHDLGNILEGYNEILSRLEKAIQ